MEKNCFTLMLEAAYAGEYDVALYNAASVIESAAFVLKKYTKADGALQRMSAREYAEQLVETALFADSEAYMLEEMQDSE